MHPLVVGDFAYRGYGTSGIAFHGIPDGPLGVVFWILVVLSVGILAALTVWGVFLRQPPED